MTAVRTEAPSRWHDLTVGLIGLGILVFCGAVAHSGRVGSVERSAFRAINDRPEWLYRILWPFQQFGNLIVALIATLAVAVWLRSWRLAAAAAVAVGLKLWLEQVVKSVVERQRPGTSIGNVHLRGDVSAHGLSFVSGHAVITAAMAGLVAPCLPRRWRWIPWTLVVLNGVARIYVGAHNPLDVIGGIGLGLVIAGLLNALFGPARAHWQRVQRDAPPAGLDPVA
jgi:undecaprenyl-diphosphatase